MPTRAAPWRPFACGLGLGCDLLPGALGRGCLGCRRRIAIEGTHYCDLRESVSRSRVSNPAAARARGPDSGDLGV